METGNNWLFGQNKVCRLLPLHSDFSAVPTSCVCNIIKYDHIITKHLWKANKCFFVFMGFKIFVTSLLVEKLWFTVLVVSNKQDKLRVIFLFPVIALLQSELVGQNIRIIQSSNFSFTITINILAQ